jgi:hypothetical protein
VTVQVYTLRVDRNDEKQTGLKPGTYCVHASEGGLSIMFRPEGDTTFWIGRAMEEER